MKKILLLIFCLGFISFLSADENESELADLFDDETLIAAVDNLGPTASGFLSANDFGPEDNQFVDPNVLRDFIESKGLIECRKKTGLLTIAGDVRARWISAGEKVNGLKQRGRGTNTAVDRYKSEVNLFFDYVAPRTWASTKLKWVSFLGKDGGSATRVELDRAFIGYDIYKQGKEDFYIEVGRSKLDYIFDSRIEFTSTFDGIHIYYTRCWPTVGNFIIHGGPFIVDSFTNHYAWIVEAGIIGWRGTGLGFKYSIVDWSRSAPTLDYGNLSKSGKKLVENNPRYSFIVSQMLFGYERKIDFLGCKTLYMYAAVLANHDAKRTPTTKGKKLNGAWYAGFTLGKLCKACDWSIDINYQSVQAQAVPEFDLSGIGRGNAANLLLSDAIFQSLAPDLAIGFTNYKGWSVSALYAMTDNLSLRAQAQYSTPRNKGIGGDFRYKAFEMTVIYAF
ncbi:MAG: hypothetical protein JJU12_02740 [Chlamydiales bacterium]|nr:hypothetical protein [Chlamydiales bacterium]